MRTHRGLPRRGRLRPAVALAVAAVLAAGSCSNGPGPGTGPPPGTAPPDDGRPRVLVFSRTTGFRHPSIPTGVAAVRRLGDGHGFAVDATEDAATFTDAGLAPYDVVVWLSTTGDVLDGDQQAAFERWVRAGGGFAGVHAAADTEYDWPFYGELVGAWFASHGLPQLAVLAVEDGDHPSTAHLPGAWVRYDEWYAFRTDPRERAHVLLTRSRWDGGTDPLAWCHRVDRGRSWYTALGHTTASFQEEAFLRHLAGGILSVAGAGAGAGVDAPAPETGC